MFLQKHCITPSAVGSKRCGMWVPASTYNCGQEHLRGGKWPRQDILDVCFGFFLPPE